MSRLWFTKPYQTNLSHGFDWTALATASFIDVMRTLLIFIAFGNFVVAAVPRAAGWVDSVGARAMAGGIRPELPPGLFFAIIWNIIFLLYLAHAVTSWRRGSFADQQILGRLVGVGGSIIVWMIAAQFVLNIWLDLVLLFPVLFLAWSCSYLLDQMGGFDGTGEKLVLCAFTGLLSGWITTAVSISIPEATAHVLDHGPSDYVWRYIWLTFICAGIFAFIFARWISRSLWYFVGLGWGIAGVATNNLVRLDFPLLGYFAVAAGGFIIYMRLVSGARGGATEL